jgi:hypothetical protein
MHRLTGVLLRIPGFPRGLVTPMVVLASAAQPEVKRVICAWGTHGALKNAGPDMIEHLWLNDPGRAPYAPKLTKDGHPAHPLYLPGDLDPILVEGE